jgi:hypothetical protein
MAAIVAVPAVPVPVAGNSFYEYLRGTLRLSHDLSAKLFGEGVTDFSVLIPMLDTSLCDMIQNIRRPGGYLQGGDGAGGAGRGAGRGAGGRGRGAGQGDVGAAGGGDGRVADRGLHVSEIQRTRIRQSGYYCYHLNRIERAFMVAEATLQRGGDKRGFN